MGDEYNPQDYPEQPSQGHPEQTSQAYPRIVQEQSPQESIKRIWLFATIFLVLIVIALGIFLFMKFSSDTISKDDLSEGTDIDLKENKEIKFEIDEEEHKLIVDAFHEDSVDVTIQSRTITANIKKGETKKFDLDDDGTYDLSIKLRSITGNKANLYIRKIDEYICTEDWECDGWDICVDEIQTRNCEDLNDCGTTKDKPNEEQECVVACIENWNCTEWSDCVNETKIRNCTDLNDCGTVENKSSEEEDCGLQLINCNDWDCMINASKNCSLVNFTNLVNMVIFGVNSSITTYYELKGMEGDYCSFYIKTEKYDLNYTDELIQQLLDSNLTQEEIDQQEQESIDQAKTLEGKDENCKVSTGNLSSTLTNWSNGNFDGEVSCGGDDCEYTGDWEVFSDCQGDYFSTEL